MLYVVWKRTVLLLGKCCDSGGLEKKTVLLLGKCCVLGSLEKTTVLLVGSVGIQAVWKRELLCFR